MIYTSNAYNLISKKLSDFKRKKIRTFQRWLELWVNSFGGRSVHIPYREQYSAYERAVMDAGITGSGTGIAMKFNEVVSSAFTGLGLDFIPKIVAASGKSWRKLPNEYQKILIETANEYGPRMTKIAADVSEKNYKVFCDAVQRERLIFPLHHLERQASIHDLSTNPLKRS